MNGSEGDIAQLKLERLQSTLNRAVRNVPFHRMRLAKATGSGMVENLEAISSLPFMERKHLGEHYPYGLFAVPLRDIVRIHTAPGTGVNPTVSGYTSQDLSHWRDIVSRGLVSCGVTPDDILQISLEGALANWGRDYKDGAETLGASVIPNTPLSIGKQLMVLRDYKTSVLITTPSVAMEIADHMYAANMNPTGFNLKTLILAGEPLTEEVEARLSESLHVTVWSHYGLSEVPGPAVAVECENHEGLHVNEDHFLLEIIDPVRLTPCPEGVEGEIVLTTLTTRAFPLIRFRTGDKAHLINTPCSCGNPHTRIVWAGKRTDGLFRISGVNVDTRLIERHMEEVLGRIPGFRYLARTEPGKKHAIELHIAMDKDLFSDEIKELERLASTLTHVLRENLGISVIVRLKEKSLYMKNG